MSGQRKSRPIVGPRTYIIDRYPLAARELPPPDEAWQTRDVPQVIRSAVLAFKQAGVIHEKDHGVERTTWETDPACYDYIQEEVSIDGLDRFPCEHRGLSNLEDGRFTCLDDDCDREYSQELAESIFC